MRSCVCMYAYGGGGEEKEIVCVCVCVRALEREIKREIARVSIRV